MQVSEYLKLTYFIAKLLIMLVLWGLLSLFSISVIITVIGATSLPSTGGTVPQGQNPDELQKQQMRETLGSKGFAMIMVGIGLFCVTIIGMIVRNYYEHKNEIVHIPPVEDKKIDVKVSLKSILKNPECKYPVPYDKVKIYPY